MGVCRRAALYLARKKGKAILLFLIFFLVSALLLICFSVLDGTGQAARDLRSNIGAAFTIRPYAQMTWEDGALREGTTPVISQQSIDEVIDAAQGQVKAYNTEHYGYAKSEQLHFLPGAGDNEASNMGQVTAVRDSGLTDVFLNEEYTLLAGRHIQPDDENKILISTELAAENSLEVGDVLTFSGRVLFDGTDIATTGLADHRRNHVAFIFQAYNLIDYLTPTENVSLTSKLPPLPILERLGLTKEETKRNVLKLSGGQQQRVAIARALASEAPVILADEPTGNLDEDTAQDITEILKENAHKMNKCVVVVTHSHELAKQADVVFRIKQGGAVPCLPPQRVAASGPGNPLSTSALPQICPFQEKAVQLPCMGPGGLGVLVYCSGRSLIKHWYTMSQIVTGCCFTPARLHPFQHSFLPSITKTHLVSACSAQSGCAFPFRFLHAVGPGTGILGPPHRRQSTTYGFLHSAPCPENHRLATSS